VAIADSINTIPSRVARATASLAIVLFARAITAVRGIFDGIEPDSTQRIYFANHASHGDFVLVWTVLPPRLRARTRPVAAAEYWTHSALRRFIGQDVFNAVLIERDPATRRNDPVTQMAEALDEGASLIVFPEGTRNITDVPLLDFKSGLYHLASARPGVELVPVWIDNLNRVLPKGGIVPVPLICTVTFGAALHLGNGEAKDAFLDRARSALLSLSPRAERPGP
jgi:1-acyl-sn-glycerol-3-phosphate acyltransferase